jgi:hypothetical protein
MQRFREKNWNVWKRFYYSKRIRNNLLEFEAINERTRGIDMKGRFRNLYIISAHAQTEEEEEKKGTIL